MVILSVEIEVDKMGGVSFQGLEGIEAILPMDKNRGNEWKSQLPPNLLLNSTLKFLPRWHRHRLPRLLHRFNLSLHLIHCLVDILTRIIWQTESWLTANTFLADSSLETRVVTFFEFLVEV